MNDVLDSKTGSWLVTMYALGSMVLAAYSFLCTWKSCSALIVAPVMPWAFLLQSELGLNISVIVYPLLLLLNASVLYSLGVSIEWALRQYREK